MTDDENIPMDDSEELQPANLDPDAAKAFEALMKVVGGEAGLRRAFSDPQALLAKALDGMSNLSEWATEYEDSLPAHFRAVGFPVQSHQELEWLLSDVITEYDVVETDLGQLYQWRDASGAEAWLHAAGEQITGVGVHFDGPARLRSSLLWAARSDDDPLYGYFHGWAAPNDEHPEVGAHPIALEMPDFCLHAGLELPAIRSVQVTALAHRLEAYASEADFYAQQDKPIIGAQAYFPMGVQAVFSGLVTDCAWLTNTLSGEPFLWAQVQTMSGEINVVAEPGVVRGEVVKGGVVKGSFCLSGRL